jgi:hypothetical protein
MHQAQTSITVAADTEIEIPAEAADGQLIARLVQHRGNVFYDVAHREAGRLRVETPLLVAVIKGTQFNVSVQEDSTTISLFEGRLEIRTPDDNEVIQLNAGEIAIRSRTDTSIRVVGMDEERAPTPTPRAAVPAAADGALADSSRVDGTRIALNGAPLANNTAAITVGGAAPNVGLAVAPSLGILTLDTKIDPRDNLNLGVALNTRVDAGAAALGLETGLNLGAGSVGLGLDTGVDLGAGTVDLGLNAGVDLGAGTVDLGLDAGIDLGAGTVDLGLDKGIELGAGAIDLGLDTGIAGIDLGVELGLGIDLGTGLEPIDLGGLAGTIIPPAPTGGGGGGGGLGGLLGGLL